MHVDSDAHFDDPDARPSAELAAALGVVVVPALLELALTHRSYAFEQGGLPHNERLEFLGDSILGQAVTVMLYRAHPDLTEGQLAKRRAALVSTIALAEIARGIGLGAYLHLGRGEHLTGGTDKDSILADTLEAVIGATYLSSGQEAATGLVLRLVEPLRDQADRFGAAMDPKTALQEVAYVHNGGAPAYEVSGTGPEHDRRFTAVVRVDRNRDGAELVRAEGHGTSKKAAEMAAALAAWTELSGAGLVSRADARGGAPAGGSADAGGAADAGAPSNSPPAGAAGATSADADADASADAGVPADGA